MTPTTSNRSSARATLTVAALAAIAGLAAPASAQRFQRLDGTKDAERSLDIEQTRDAGYVTAGSVETFSAAGNVDEDFYIIKHRKDGSVEWSTRYGGPGRDRATSIHQTQDGGYIVAGHTESADPGLGLALLRLDPLGNPVWAYAYEAGSFERLINPAEPDYYLQPAVRESRETGDIVVVTNTRNQLGGQFPVYVRTDASGALLTNVTYIDPARGDATFAGFTDLKELTDGSLGITGFWADADPTPDGTPFVFNVDILGMRAAPSGAPFWVAHYDEAPSPQSFEAGHGLDVSSDDRLFTIGAIARRPFPGAPTFLGTDHVMLDAITGAVVATHYLDQMTPAYAATRFTKQLQTVTSGIDLLNQGAPAGVGPGAAVLLKPAYTSVDRYFEYGPASPNAPQRLEAVAVTDLSCGFAFTGPKTNTLGLGGPDQLLVKTNDNFESGCYELRLPPQQAFPGIEQIQMAFEPQLHDLQDKWGQQIEWQTDKNVLCYADRCKPCPADLNGDGVVDNGDIGVFVALFLGGSPLADFNGDGIIDNGDINAFIAAFLSGC